MSKTKLNLIQKASLYTAIVISVIILAAWLIPGIRSIYSPNWDLMRANTAVCVLLSALFLLNRQSFARSPLQIIFPALIFLVAGAAFFTHLTGTYFSAIHDVLVVEYVAPMPGLMSLQTSIFFLVFSIFIVLQKTRLAENFYLPSVGGVLFFSYIFLLFSGYLFGAVSLVGQSNEIKTSPHTLLAMFFLVISYIMWTLPNSLFSIMISKNESGRMVRSLLPWTVLIPYSILVFGYRVFYLEMLPPNIAAALVGTITSAAIGLLVIVFGYKINTLHNQLADLALRDPLTGCYNPRGFYQIGLEFGKRKNEADAEIGIIYFDLDNLKQVNDTYGHEAGSQHIIDFVQLITHNSREGDILGRLGGDEFALLIEETSIALVLDRFSQAIQTFNAESNKPYALLYSYGTCYGQVTNPETFERLVNRADQAMYAQKMSKRQG